MGNGADSSKVVAKRWTLRKPAAAEIRPLTQGYRAHDRDGLGLGASDPTGPQRSCDTSLQPILRLLRLLRKRPVTAVEPTQSALIRRQ
jgi:hypothetical protein